MKKVNKELVGLGFEVQTDEEGYVQASPLVKKAGRQKFESQNLKFDLNKVEGLTDFQKKIYKELVKIPAGKNCFIFRIGQKGRLQKCKSCRWLGHG